MRVKEWMSASPTTTDPKTSVSEARELMRRKVIRHLLVTEGERLVGIVTDRHIRLNLPSTETDLLRAFVYSKSAAPQPAAVGPPVTARG